MNLLEIVKDSLINTYFGSFDFEQQEPNRFIISIVGSEQQYFTVEVYLRNESRLKITVKPERYATALVNSMGRASSDKKEAFCKIWDTLSAGMSVKINDEILSKERFLNFDDTWSRFELNYSVFPLDDSESEAKEKIAAECVLNIYAMMFSLASFEIEGFSEGKEVKVVSTKYERNPLNRRICLASKGYKCSVCGVLLEDIYGPLAKKFIEVHHSNPVADMDENHVVKPLEELFPVCPNCHAMLHRKKPPYTIDELKEKISQYGNFSYYALSAEPEAEYNLNVNVNENN